MPRCPKACASSRIAAAGTPVTRSPSSSVHGSIDSRNSSKPVGRARDELLVHEPGVDDLAGDGVRERDVGADVEPEPEIGPLRRGGAARVDDHQLRAAVHRLQQVVEEDRVRLARVRAPEHDQVRGLTQLLVGAGTAACTEHRRQTDDARSVSGAVTAVDVVGVQRDPAELLRREVQLVRRLRAAEDAGLAAARRAPSGSRPRRDRAPRPSLPGGALRRHERAAGSAASGSEPCLESRRACESPASQAVVRRRRTSSLGARPFALARVELLRAHVGAARDERLEQRRVVAPPARAPRSRASRRGASRWRAGGGVELDRPGDRARARSRRGAAAGERSRLRTPAWRERVERDAAVGRQLAAGDAEHSGRAAGVDGLAARVRGRRPARRAARAARRTTRATARRCRRRRAAPRRASCGRPRR